MDSNEFIDKVKSQYDEPNDDDVALETEFRSIPGWGSIVGLGIIMMIADEYGVEMAADDLKSAKTVKDIYDFVVAHKGH